MTVYIIVCPIPHIHALRDVIVKSAVVYTNTIIAPV